MGKKFLVIIILILLLSSYNSISSARSNLFENIRRYNLEEIIGTYTTYFDINNSNRNTNIRIASENIDGTLIMPGEIFSFNEVVGPRTKELGYKKALEIVNGEFVEGIGGGICQVSSTLYNSVLLADLEIIERTNHSRPVNYIDLGRGATIYYGQIDFKFKNNRKEPIIILSSVVNNQSTVSIIGRVLNQRVEIKKLPVRTIEHKVVKRIDKTINLGEEIIVREGRNGFQVTIKRILKDGNEVIREEIISNDTYQPQNTIIKFNPIT